jgi:hypothetical protein
MVGKMKNFPIALTVSEKIEREKSYTELLKEMASIAKWSVIKSVALLSLCIISISIMSIIMIDNSLYIFIAFILSVITCISINEFFYSLNKFEKIKLNEFESSIRTLLYKKELEDLQSTTLEDLMM